jgi:hypothetical protein
LDLSVNLLKFTSLSTQSSSPGQDNGLENCIMDKLPLSPSLHLSINRLPKLNKIMTLHLMTYQLPQHQTLHLCMSLGPCETFRSLCMQRFHFKCTNVFPPMHKDFRLAHSECSRMGIVQSLRLLPAPLDRTDI